MFPESAEGTIVDKPVIQTQHRLTRPQQSSTPTPEDLAVKFDMSDMPDLEVDKTTVTVDDKKVEKPLVEDKKADEKKEVPPDDKKEKKEEEVKTDGISKHLKAPSDEKPKDKGVEKKEQVKQIKVPESGTFDYSVYNQEEQFLLKNMSKESRAFADKLYKENKELAKTKDYSYLQHPQSYVLNPDFQKMQEDVQYAFKEGQYWQTQLEACKKGAKIRAITGWKADGSPDVGPEIDPTDAAEEQIRLSMQNCFTQGQQLRGQLQQFPKQYQQRMQQDLQGINNERASRFQWVADPKLLKYSINTEGGEKTIETIKKDFIGIFPPYLRNNPGVEVASDLMVAMIIQKAELDEARAGQKVSDIKIEEVKRGEPSSDSKPKDKPKGPNGSPSTFSMDGLDM